MSYALPVDSLTAQCPTRRAPGTPVVFRSCFAQTLRDQRSVAVLKSGGVNAKMVFHAYMATVHTYFNLLQSLCSIRQRPFLLFQLENSPSVVLNFISKILNLLAACRGQSKRRRGPSNHRPRRGNVPCANA